MTCHDVVNLFQRGTYTWATKFQQFGPVHIRARVEFMTYNNPYETYITIPACMGGHLTSSQSVHSEKKGTEIIPWGTIAKNSISLGYSFFLFLIGYRNSAPKGSTLRTAN